MGTTDGESPGSRIVERDRVGGHRLDLTSKHVGRETGLLYRSSATGLGHFAGVRGLVIVGRRRERDQDRRAPGSRQFGNGRSSRASHEKVRVGELLRHVLDIGQQLGRYAKLRIGLANAFDVVGPALLYDLQTAAQRWRQEPQAG